MKSIVFDSWPLIAFFEGQKAADTVQDILINSGSRHYLTTVNLGEIWYTIARTYSSGQAEEVMHQILELNFTIKPADWPLTKIAAGFKAKGGISYADCFAAALAKQTGSVLLTGDREFSRVEKEIEIMWLPR